MRALRRVTNKDLNESTFIHQFALQAHMAEQAGEISNEMRNALVNIAARLHVGIAARSGVLDRMRQRRYDRRYPPRFTNQQIFDGFVAITLFGLIVVWILI